MNYVQVLYVINFPSFYSAFSVLYFLLVYLFIISFSISVLFSQKTHKCRSCRSLQELSFSNRTSIPTSLCLETSASIQPRTSPPKFQISFPLRQFNCIFVSHCGGTGLRAAAPRDGLRLQRQQRHGEQRLRGQGRAWGGARG